MTKRRAPLSVEAALARIAGQLDNGYETMGELSGRGARMVRKWGDPDAPEQIPFDCAIEFDLAYIAAGGEGAPLYEAYAHRLEMAEAACFADAHALGRQAAALIREYGEAGGALVVAAQPGATAAEHADAERELLEALETGKRALALLQRSRRPRSTGPPLDDTQA